MNYKLFKNLYNRSIDLLPDTATSKDTGNIQYHFAKTCIDWLEAESYISDTQADQLLDQVKGMTLS